VALALTRTTANTPALALYHSVGFRKTKTFVSPEGITLCSLEWVRREAPEVGP
jgi:ribosomal protein S18 acetylase RimI-like enzyme